MLEAFLKSCFVFVVLVPLISIFVEGYEVVSGYCFSWEEVWTRIQKLWILFGTTVLVAISVAILLSELK